MSFFRLLPKKSTERDGYGNNGGDDDDSHNSDNSDIDDVGNNGGDVDDSTTIVDVDASMPLLFSDADDADPRCCC